MHFRDAFSALLRLLGFAPRRQFILVLALMLLSALTEGIGIMLLVPLIQLAAPQTGPSAEPMALPWLDFLQGQSMALILALFIALVAARALLLYGQQVRTTRLIHHVVDNLRGQCFDAVIHAEWRWLTQKQAALFNSLIITNVARIGAGLQQATGLIAGVASALAFLGAALVLDWTLALAAIAGGGVLMLLVSGHRKRVVQLGQALGAANQALHGQVQEGVAGIRLTRIWQGEHQAKTDFADTVSGLRQIQINHQISTGRGRIALQVGGAVLLAAIVYLGLDVLAISQAVLLPLLLVFMRLVPTLGSLQVAWHYWLHTVPALTEAEALLADARAAAEPLAAADAPPIGLNRELRLHGVSVRYATRERASLCDFSATIPAFTTNVITGPSGAGKSTLADVLTGLITPDSGQLLIDGQAITGGARVQWRRSVAYVQQDSFLFNASVRANLRRAVPHAKEADMIAALQLAAADFVLALPQGLDTLVGDNGVRLSGGERQRIALARALLRKPGLLILDEATSAVDHDNELAIQQAIARLNGQMTIIAITHRGFRDMAADQVIQLTAPERNA